MLDMKEAEIRHLIDIRKYIIECHNSLDGGNVSTAVVKQADVAAEYERIVRSLDSLLSQYVNFD